MRVLLSTYGSRGDVEPLVGLAARLRELGTEVRMCAPPDEDFAQRLAGVGVPLVPVCRVAAVVHHGGAGTTTTAARLLLDAVGRGR